VPEDITVCLGEESEVSATVKNTGEHTEEVYLTASGDVGDFVSFSEESFTLEPDEEKEVTITLLPVDIEYGAYTLTVEAKSTTSYARSSVESFVEITKCYDVEVTYFEEVKACAGEAKSFGITIKNIGLKNDTYEVTVEDLGYSDLINLAPEEFKTIDLKFLKEEEGTYEIPFTVSSDFVTKEGTITFILEKCYGVDLTLEETIIQIESGKGKLVKGIIKNTGTLVDTFNIISDVIWSTVRPERITLESEQEEDVYAYYSPEFEISGNQTAKLTAKSTKSEDTEELTIKVMPREEVPTTILVEETTTVEEIIIEENVTTVEEETTVMEETTILPEEETTIEENVTTVEEEIVETTELPVEAPEIPTGEFVGIIETIMGNKLLRSLLIAIIVVLIILIIVYLVVMR